MKNVRVLLVDFDHNKRGILHAARCNSVLPLVRGMSHTEFEYGPNNDFTGIRLRRQFGIGAGRVIPIEKLISCWSTAPVGDACEEVVGDNSGVRAAEPGYRVIPPVASATNAGSAQPSKRSRAPNSAHHASVKQKKATFLGSLNEHMPDAFRPCKNPLCDRYFTSEAFLQRRSTWRQTTVPSASWEGGGGCLPRRSPTSRHRKCCRSVVPPAGRHLGFSSR